RWQHPQHDLLMPDEFIPLAEESGLISALTDFVLEEAIKQMRLWRDDGLPMSVAVNLAPQLLHQMDLPDRVGEMLKSHDMKGDNLILEITETAAMTDTTRTMDILTRFRIKDIGLSIDDFGTGYSSFVQLYRMPFSELKIDKSFVLDMHQDEEAEIIVRSIANLGHNLGLSLCAEGVETRESLDLLRSFGCEKMQGYLVSRPLEADALGDFVADWDPQTV
ncbi:MAG: EAL domain-containing protein, partial [Alphaproteobacteria bacterium]|nr:EAL domain-containing protein [Alphaproteobacteria bacterium]